MGGPILTGSPASGQRPSRRSRSGWRGARRAPPELLHRRRLRLGRSLRRLWQVPELIWTVAERDFRVRYKQAALGVAGAVLTPVLLMGALPVAAVLRRWPIAWR